MRQRKSGPLRGLRVVSLAEKMTAKLVGMMLADNGATVVEVESPGNVREPNWEIMEETWRRGKNIVPLEGPTQLAHLIGAADVFVTDLAAQTLQDLDASPQVLAGRCKELVVLQISGYGTSSARRDTPWSETLVMAEMGFPWLQEGPRDGPRMPSFQAGSYAAAFNGMSGLLAALHIRRETGNGQIIDTSILDGLTAQQPMGWYWNERHRTPDTPIDIAAGGMGRLVLAAYRCQDGEWVHIHTGAKGAFSRLMTLAGLDEQIPPLPINGQSEIGQPIEKWQLELIHETLPKLFATKPREAWIKILRRNEISAMPDLLPGECFINEQALENQLSALTTLSSGESVRVAGAALKFSETPAVVGFIPTQPTTTEDAIEELLKHPNEPASAKRKTPPKYPLAGLRVVDFGIYFAGPYASRLLADLGADVIKLENLNGCPMRAISQGRYFNAANHHKRTIAIDLKQPQARDIIARLVAQSDVVHHNLRPGVAETLGMGYADLQEINPSLIYCHSSAFGSLGPYRYLPGFEPLSSAVTGLLMRHEGCRDTGPYAAIGSMDPGNGLLGAAGILMALYHRDRTGEGQLVECPQMGSAIMHLADTVIREDGTILDPCRVDRDQYGFGWWKRLYRCSDGWIVVDAWCKEARSALLRMADADEGNALDRLGSWASGQSVDAALATLKELYVPAGRVGPPFSSDRFFFDEENVRQKRVIEFADHPKWGRYRDLGLFWRFSQTPLRTAEDGHYAPEIGRHTADILGELGFDQDRIASWSERKIVRVA